MFRDQSKLFIDHLQEKNASGNTIRAYKADIGAFFRVWEQSKSTSFQQALGKFYLKTIKLKRNTMARKIATLRSFREFLLTQHIDIPEIKPFPFTRTVPLVISQQAMTEILDRDFDNLRDQAIMELFYATGVKTGELAKIQIQDVNLDEKQITIYGRKNRIRTVFFGNKAKQALIKYLNKERKTPESCREPLFLNFGNNNNGISTRSVNFLFEQMRSNFAQVGKLKPSTIRHSFATHLIDSGVDMITIKQLLGHRDLQKTMEYERYAASTFTKILSKVPQLGQLAKNKQNKSKHR